MVIDIFYHKEPSFCSSRLGILKKYSVPFSACLCKSKQNACDFFIERSEVASNRLLNFARWNTDHSHLALVPASNFASTAYKRSVNGGQNRSMVLYVYKLWTATKSKLILRLIDQVNRSPLFDHQSWRNLRRIPSRGGQIIMTSAIFGACVSCTQILYCFSLALEQ